MRPKVIYCYKRKKRRKTMMISDNKTKKILMLLNIVVSLMFLASVFLPFYNGKTEFLSSVSFRAVAILYFVFYIWFVVKNNKILLKIIMSIFSLILIISCFSKSVKVTNIIDNLVLILLFVILVLSVLKKRSVFASAIVFTYFLIQASIYAENTVLFENKTVYFIAIADAVLCTVLSVVIYKKKLAEYAIKSTLVKLIILCLIFMLTSYTSFILYKNFNYTLDRNQPIPEEMIVENKEVRYSADLTKKEYYLTVYHKDKTISIKVSEDDYNHYLPGDIYSLNIYDGVLKQKYYINNN